MDLKTLEQHVDPLLDDLTSRDNIQRLRDALRYPEQRPVDRPWTINRYTPADVPGIESVWERVAKALRPLLTHEEPIKRSLGCLLLHYAPSPAVASDVIPLIDDPELTVAISAINSLAEMGVVEAAPTIAESLASPSRELRQSSAAALGKLGDQSYVEALRGRLVDDPSPQVRDWAANSLGEIGGDAAQAALLAALQSDDLHPVAWLGIRGGLQSIGADAVGPLRELARSDQHFPASLALEALALIDDGRVDDALYEALEGNSEVLAIAAAWGLMQRGNVRGKLHLAKKLGTDDPVVSLSAAARLADQGERTGLTHLLERYFDLDARPLVSWSLSTLAPRYRAQVVDLLDDPSPRVARAAIDLVGVYGAQALTSRLQTLLDHREPSVAFGAAVSLMRLHGAAAADAARQVMEGHRKAKNRLALVSVVRELWQPLPAALATVLLKDPSAPIVLVGVESLVNSDATDKSQRLFELIARQRARLLDEEPRLDPKQNRKLLSMKGFRDALATLEAAFERRLPDALNKRSELEASKLLEEGLDKPAVVILRGALAALVQLGDSVPLGPVASLLGLPSAVVRYRALQTLIALGGRDAVEKIGVDPTSEDHPLVRSLWQSARALPS